MANLQVARDFFQRHLPDTIQTQLDFDTLELQPGTYIDKALQLSFSDVLYKIRFFKKAEPTFLYVLAEHQSSVDKLMPFRLWQYIVAIWAEYLKKNKGNKLPLVIPLVFYNGSKKYDGVRDIRELIQAPMELIEQFLLKPFYLVDVHEIKDEELRNQQWSALMEFVMKHAYEKEALNFVQLFSELLNRVLQENGSTDFVTSVLKYFMSQVGTANPDKLVKILEAELSKSKKSEIMATIETIESYLIKKGMQQGVQQGIKQGERTVLECLLQDKFSKIPDDYHQQIEEANTELLLTWIRRVPNSRTIEEIFRN